MVDELERKKYLDFEVSSPKLDVFEEMISRIMSIIFKMDTQMTDLPEQKSLISATDLLSVVIPSMLNVSHDELSSGFKSLLEEKVPLEKRQEMRQDIREQTLRETAVVEQRILNAFDANVIDPFIPALYQDLTKAQQVAIQDYGQLFQTEKLNKIDFTDALKTTIYTQQLAALEVKENMWGNMSIGEIPKPDRKILFDDILTKHEIKNINAELKQADVDIKLKTDSKTAKLSEVTVHGVGSIEQSVAEFLSGDTPEGTNTYTAPVPKPDGTPTIER